MAGSKNNQIGAKSVVTGSGNVKGGVWVTFWQAVLVFTIDRTVN
jgi:hypothetical protein